MLNDGIRDVSALIRRSPTGRRRISLQHSAFSLQYLVDPDRFELSTSPLSGVRSNQLSYGSLPTEDRRWRMDDGFHLPSSTLHLLTIQQRIRRVRFFQHSAFQPSAFRTTDLRSSRATPSVLRKEVIQPQVLLRLPCYDFVPLTGHTFTPSPLAVGPGASGATDSGDVTGGVYKARERIHRSIADLRLLAIPTSRSRVADSDPNWDALFGIGSTSRYRCPLYAPL